mgnify:CR=1 FL=1
MKRCLFLSCKAGHAPSALVSGPWAGRVDFVDQRRFPDLDLGGHGAIVLSMLTDQASLSRHADKLDAVLDGGGTVVVNGHVAYPLVSGLQPFMPQTGHGVEPLRVSRLGDHPVYAGVADDDLTFRRGVAGFYGRGHNPPPNGAVALNGLGPDRVALDWEWRRPGGGIVFMHCGLDLWAYANDPTSAARMAPQLMDWLFATSNGAS